MNAITHTAPAIDTSFITLMLVVIYALGGSLGV
jgi:hypothetical protein